MSATPFLAAALTLAEPRWLWALLLAVPLVLFHLYRRRRLVVAFLPLFLEGIPRRGGLGGWQRLRERLSLLLRLGSLAALVFALAGPVAGEASRGATTLVVVVDADLTTSAREADGRVRLLHALELARRRVQAEAPTRTHVLLARGVPEVLVADADASRTLEALRGLEEAVGRGDVVAGPGTADLEAAVRLARDAARSEAAGPPLVITSRALGPAGAQDVEVVGVGRVRDDQGFAALEPGWSLDAAFRARVSLRNDAEEVRSRVLAVRLDDELLWSREMQLEAGGRLDVELDVPVPPRAGWLEVRLEGEDAFAANDAFVLRRTPRPRPSLLVVAEGGVRPWTLAVLEALAPELDLERSGRVRPADLARAAPRDVTLVDGVPLPPSSLRPGAWVFLAPLAGELPFRVGETIERPLLWRSAPGHPLVADLDLDTVYVARGEPVEGEGLVPLAEAEGRALVAEGERDGVRYVVLGLDARASDLPLRAAFPLLVRHALRRLFTAPAAPLAPLYVAGEPLRPLAPLPGGPAATIGWDGGVARATLTAEGEAWRVPQGASGRARIVTGGEAGEAGIFDTAFLDLDPTRTIASVRPPAPPSPAGPAQGAGAPPVRRLLLGVALGLLLLDLLLLAALARPSAKLASWVGAP